MGRWWEQISAQSSRANHAGAEGYCVVSPDKGSGAEKRVCRVFAPFPALVCKRDVFDQGIARSALAVHDALPSSF